MVSHSKPTKHSEPTPTTSPSEDRVMGGQNTSFSERVFKSKGRSDAKLKMMKKLEAIGVGFEELEKINTEFNLRIRSETLKNQMREGKYNNKKLPTIQIIHHYYHPTFMLTKWAQKPCDSFFSIKYIYIWEGHRGSSMTLFFLHWHTPFDFDFVIQRTLIWRIFKDSSILVRIP